MQSHRAGGRRLSRDNFECVVIKLQSNGNSKIVISAAYTLIDGFYWLLEGRV